MSAPSSATRSAGPPEKSGKSPPGRYDPFGKNDDRSRLPRQGNDFNREIKHGWVDDPFPIQKGRRQPVAINKHCDVLETEYAYHRLSEAAYLAGRRYQAILERSSGCTGGGGQWREGDRVDADLAHEIAIIRGLDSAAKSVEMLIDTQPIIGLEGERVLFHALIERKTFAEIVPLRKRCPSGKAGIQHIGAVFRQSCEHLGELWGISVGPERTATPRIRSWVEDRNNAIIEGEEPPAHSA